MVQILNGKIVTEDITQTARGGTELMANRILSGVSPELLEPFQISISRVRDLDPTKKKVYLLQDLAEDPEVNHLRNGGWKKFDKLVFVSHWQRQMYKTVTGVPFDASIVLENAITPIESHTKPEDKVRLVYFSTPHRGLHIAFAAFDKLYQKYGDKIEFNVFSSFDLYGWGDRDEQFKELFDALKAHPGVNYSKSVSNDVIREELKRSHILAYPSVWEETSCMVLIESMCAGLMCVHSSLGALPETSLGMTRMYNYVDDQYAHLNMFTLELDDAISATLDGYGVSDERIEFANDFFSWDNRKLQWEGLLTSLS